MRKRAASSFSGASSAATAVVELHRGGDAVGVQRLGARAIDAARLARRLLQRAELRLAALDRVERRAHLAHLLGQHIDLAAVLAGRGAQIEQARLDAVERQGIVRQRLGRALQAVLGLARLDHRTVQRFHRLAQQRVLASDPLEPPRRAAQGRERRVRALPQVLQRDEVIGQALTLLHGGARLGEFLLLTLDRGQRGQFGKVRE